MSGARVFPSQKVALGACGLFRTCQRDFYSFSGGFLGVALLKNCVTQRRVINWGWGEGAVPVQRRTQQSQAEAETRSLRAPGSAVTSFSSLLTCRTVSGFNKFDGFYVQSAL